DQDYRGAHSHPVRQDRQLVHANWREPHPSHGEQRDGAVGNALPDGVFSALGFLLCLFADKTLDAKSTESCRGRGRSGKEASGNGQTKGGGGRETAYRQRGST